MYIGRPPCRCAAPDCPILIVYAEFSAYRLAVYKELAREVLGNACELTVQNMA